MKIDREAVRKIAFLSRLEVEDRLDETKDNFENIFKMIEEFNEVDCTGVDPLVSVNDTHQVCRNDEVVAGGNAEAILATAPKVEYGYIVVPKVVGEEA